MFNIVVSSLNPAKFSAVEAAFKQVFPDIELNIEGVSVNSGVPDQPMNNEETLLGANNRVDNAILAKPNADFYVGLEGGIDNQTTFAWMVIESATKKRSQSRSASLPLPPKAIDMVHGGLELGDVMDIMFQQKNIKQKGGAMGLLTDGVLSRSAVYHQALILALVPFIHPELF
ncbi:inosine/xanthosine triphosphatase [Vibrio sp. SS-MA-C1-2]|uniref:inosine/xanthosine triphosphatase n=1 Tax=Vibrio sp. SS-MA-C1-2 TaxID=2908646 RepID=UPI001F279215|nr:inosine/xanthosine triphosphatase [Vibrio sp. SS-MA-C1-2]UJF19726.1 inosine/xanthosine triphosphatase [Vibrio sp. SS-MA-C1-2]